MKMRLVGLIPLFALSVFAAPEVMAAASQNAALRTACMADAKRLCGKHLGNPKARMACMRANRSKLSAGCRAAADKRRQQLIAVCRKRLMPKLKGAGREKARASVRSCVMSEMQKR
jgi:hypothetical protein